FSVNEDTRLAVTGRGVLANDRDVDPEPIFSVLVTQPANGDLVLDAVGSFTYMPHANFHGTDSFTYKDVALRRIDVGGGVIDVLEESNVATVTITVGAVNDAPVALDDGFSVDEDG